MPEISVLLPVYNGCRCLAFAIESVQKQTFQDWELLIIDDGSEDGSGNIAANFAGRDKRIKLICQDQNRGLVASLNKGLLAAAGEFVARIDSDDEWSRPEKLERQLNFMRQHPEVGLLGTRAQVISPSGQPGRILAYPDTDSRIRRQILIRNCFVHSSILARREVMQECGGYKEKDKLAEDYGLWLRLGLSAKFANLPEVCVNYQLSSSGITQSQNSAQIDAASRIIAQFQGRYPNFWLATLKWNIQKLLAGFRQHT